MKKLGNGEVRRLAKKVGCSVKDFLFHTNGGEVWQLPSWNFMPVAPRTEESKSLVAEKTRAYWKTPEGEKKRERLRARNKATKSEELKRRWREDPDYARKATEAASRPKSERTKEKMSIAGKRRWDLKKMEAV